MMKRVYKGVAPCCYSWLLPTADLLFAATRCIFDSRWRCSFPLVLSPFRAGREEEDGNDDLFDGEKSYVRRKRLDRQIP